MMTMIIIFSKIKVRCSTQTPSFLLLLKKKTCQDVNIIDKFKKQSIFVHVFLHNHFGLVFVIIIFGIFTICHLTARPTISLNHFQYSHVASASSEKLIIFHHPSSIFIKKHFNILDGKRERFAIL